MKEWLCCLACFFPSQKDLSPKNFLTELTNISTKRNEMCIYLDQCSFLEQISYAENNSVRWASLQSEAKEKIQQLEKKALNVKDYQSFSELKRNIEQQERTWEQIIVRS